MLVIGGWGSRLRIGLHTSELTFKKGHETEGSERKRGKGRGNRKGKAAMPYVSGGLDGGNVQREKSKGTSGIAEVNF